MTKRVKSTGLKTRNEFEAALDDVAAMTVEQRKLEAERDERIQAVQEQFNDDILDIALKVKAKLALAEKYAKAHRNEVLNEKKKSGETPLALFGFRTGNPSLVLLNKKWNWDEVTETLQETGLGKFVVTKRTPDKDAMKAKLSDEELAAVGCRIKQSESFWVEPKLEKEG
ncbi:MAG: host-nuclease inhibitor Gam family protein [Pontiellaceae bacterium]|nr:host-nuclease inhibitor Gam family protein [Pontiellaceae bacterium]